MQLTLDGRTALETKLDMSIELLREFEPPEGYYLAFSGGKDSVALLQAARLAGVRYDVHYSMTTIDPPEVTRFIRREFPEVEWEVPKRNFFAGVRANGLPTRTCRWCCRELKEIGGVDRIVLTGIRAEESARRRKRGVFAPCHKQRKWFLSPLMDWTETDVWAFHEREGLPHCSLYDEGWSRIGCVICPFEHNTERSMARWPVFWRLTQKASAIYWAQSEATQSRWATAEAFWQWWIHRERACPLPEDQRPPTLSFED
jgi:phosphoadenosine phosphosulfate reductase